MSKKKKQDIPRFALTLVDTETMLGDRYLTVSIGADKLMDFVKSIPEAKRVNPGETEFNAMLYFFQEQVDKSDAERIEGEATTKYKVDKNV